MAEDQNAQDEQGDAQGARVATDDADKGSQQDPPGSDAQGEDSGDTFTREYVEELRTEAATHRVAAKRAGALEVALREATIKEGASAVLQDVTDLPWTDDYNDPETGLPSVELVRTAAEELADRKPHLARVRGDIGQGRHSENSEDFSLAGVLRQNA